MDQLLLTDLVSIYISQMDISEVRNAMDDILKNLGLIKVGDRLSLPLAFVSPTKQKENDGKRKKLLEVFYSSKSQKLEKMKK